MKTITLVIASTMVFATLALGKKFTMTAASIVPAASGSVLVGKDRNGNTDLKVKVEHLAKPQNLSPAQTSYIVWLQNKDAVAENKGELKVNGKLSGSFQATTPSKKFDLFITGETDGAVKSPAGPEVLRISISR